MKSIKLSQELKMTIANNAVKAAGIDARMLVAQDALAVLALQLRVKGFGGEEVVAKIDAWTAKVHKEAIDVAKLAPRGVLDVDDLRLFRRQTGVEVNFGGYKDFIVYPRKDGGRQHLSTPRGCVVVKPTDPLYKEWEKLTAETTACTTERVGISTAVLTTLKQINTTKQLLQAWPEAIELLPKATAEVVRTVPAVIVADLNKLKPPVMNWLP